ncbi:MAG: hypothetical protein M1828_001390 [Chrysothrix sp. TS-e1954]|nr:MAG: hypothetical protein M1828_001390 [Chrysothrix sp. TS-e1954]
MSSLLLSGLEYFHTPSSQVAAQSRQVRKAKSHGSLLSPILEAVRRPTAALDAIVEDYRNVPCEESPTKHYAVSRKAVLHVKLRDAETFQDWQNAAIELDQLDGHNDWKLAPKSHEYNVALVASRLKQLDDARISRDVKRMLNLIRTSFTRHLGGMGNIRLYKHSHIGTKDLIERYIDSALETINVVLDITRTLPDQELDSRQALEQILAARQSFGRSALLLSGGGTFGMNHIGVLKSLWEAKLLPRIISGASAGSIVCAVLCTRTDDEMPTTFEDFCYGDLDVFTKPGEPEGLLQQVARFMKHGSLFDISNLTRVMRSLMGDMTFQEAYNRTRRILNICVSSASVYELPRLLNYVTAPNVIIWSAVAASCSVPLIFSPADLLAKDPRTGEAVTWNSSAKCWIDGSVDNDLPMTRLAEMFNVNHFIVSQVNPHVVPFLVREEDSIASEARASESSVETGPGWIHTLSTLAKDEAMHRMQMLSELGVFPNLLTKTRSILSQRYSGDITIFPEVPYSAFPKVLTNPTTEFMVQACHSGERATWPKMSRIQNHCAIELALDDAVQQLRARIAFSPSQADDRLQTTDQAIRRAGSESHGSLQRRRHQKRLKTGLDGAHHLKRKSVATGLSGGPIMVSALTPTAPKVSQHLHSSRSFDRLSNSQKKPVRFELTPPDAAENSHSDYEDSGSSTPTTMVDSEESGYEDSGSEDDNDAESTGLKPYTHLPNGWPTSDHKLFPHASQPVTPLRRNSQSRLSINGSTLPISQPSPQRSSISLAMTLATAKPPPKPSSGRISPVFGPSEPSTNHLKITTSGPAMVSPGPVTALYDSVRPPTPRPKTQNLKLTKSKSDPV